MPSARRLRLLLIGVIAVVVITLVYTSQLRTSQDRDGRTLGDFYHRTADALERARSGQQQQTVVDTNNAKTKTDGEKKEDSAQVAKDMQARLKAAEQKAKDSANAKVLRPEKPEQVIGVGSAAGGQKAPGEKASGGKPTNKIEDTDEDHVIESTINDILKKSPGKDNLWIKVTWGWALTKRAVIIFSKTSCPFSKRAKGLLLEEYTIDPEPYVVELDTHPLGRKIQDRLATMTGRKTVPNIMVNGKSIGGSDEIVAMHKKRELAETIQSFGSVGGKTIVVKEGPQAL